MVDFVTLPFLTEDGPPTIEPLRALAVKIPTAAKSSAAGPDAVTPATVIVSFFRMSKR